MFTRPMTSGVIREREKKIHKMKASHHLQCILASFYLACQRSESFTCTITNRRASLLINALNGELKQVLQFVVAELWSRFLELLKTSEALVFPQLYLR